MLKEERKFVNHRQLLPPHSQTSKRVLQKVLFAGILFTVKLTPLLNMLTQRNDARNDRLTATITKPFFFNTMNFFVGFQEVQQNQQRLVTVNSEAATPVLIYFA